MSHCNRLGRIVFHGMLLSLLTACGVGGSDSSSESTSDNTQKSYAIVDTNQATCYNSSTGQATTCSGLGYDGDYAGNQPSYYPIKT